jgi:KipI family sensor histidine kinase inhibitor
MTPRLLDCGECALTVEFGTVIDDALAAQVLALDAALAAVPVPGIVETVPTYRSLMVHYDPLVLPRTALAAQVQAALQRPAPAAIGSAGRLWRLPACYAPDLAEDLAHVAAATGLVADRVTALHAGATYRVVMYGFAPGWAYLSGLPPALTLPRRASPRDRIPAGSLIVAGGQAIAAALAMPSGWHIIGRTPVRLFDADRDPAFLFSPGDRLRFDAVDRASFAALQARAAAGEALARQVPE